MSENLICSVCGKEIVAETDEWVDQTVYHTDEQTQERRIVHLSMHGDCFMLVIVNLASDAAETIINGTTPGM